MGQILSIVSGKGGTGKSTVSYGLGIAFCEMGKSVLLVDLDEGLRSLDIISGIDDLVVKDLSDILEGDSLDSGIYKSKYYDNMYIIPAPLHQGSINYINLSEFLKQVKDRFDIIIFDFPAGIDPDKLSAVGYYGTFISVSNMDPVSLRDVSSVKSGLPQSKFEPRLIINRFNIEYIKDGVYGDIDGMIDKAELRLLGLIPGSCELMMLSLTHKLNKKGKPFAAFKRIAKRISGEDIKLPKPSKI